MLRLSLDLVPFGLLDPEPIGRLDIANDGGGDALWGTYRYRVAEGRDGVERVSRWRALPVRHFRPDGAWPLVAACLADHARRERRAGRRRRAPG